MFFSYLETLPRRNFNFSSPPLPHGMAETSTLSLAVD